MKILGIDPGAKGALAVLEDGEIIEVHDLPFFHIQKGGRKRGVLDHRSLFSTLRRHLDATLVWLEEAQVMPKQGIVTGFNYGVSFGGVLGVVACSSLPYELLRPSVWKRRLGVPADKDAARYTASRILPRAAGFWPLVKHDGRAEAALIAHYGWLEARDGKA